MKPTSIIECTQRNYSEKLIKQIDNAIRRGI